MGVTKNQEIERRKNLISNLMTVLMVAEDAIERNRDRLQDFAKPVLNSRLAFQKESRIRVSN